MGPPLSTWIARAIAAVWAAWWSFFALAEARFGGSGWAESLPAFLFTALVWLLALLPWRWPAVGGLLVATGVFVIACYPLGILHAKHPSWIWFVVGTLALPAIVAGLLFLAGGSRRAAAGMA